MTASDGFANSPPSSRPARTDWGQPGQRRPHATPRSERRALADQLLEQYSPKLAVILGAHPYPDLARSTATCPHSGLTGDHTGGLTARLLRPSTLRSGSKVQIDVEFTNSTDRAIELPQPLGAYLGDGHRILSTNAHVAQLAVLYPPIIVQPGQSITTPVDLSTAAWDPADGYQLPPGDYTLEVPLGTTWVSAAITVTP